MREFSAAFADPVVPVDFHEDEIPLPPEPWTDPLPSNDFAAEVEAEVRRIKIRTEARARLNPRPDAEPLDAGTLAEILARPPDPAHRVAELLPWSASGLVSAQRKTGKTTLTLNLARCLLTGEDFLGRFAVRPVTGVVALLNYEVSAGQIARWADDVGVHRDRLFLVNLRGRRNPLTDPQDRAELAERLRSIGTESLIVDPFGRAYTGASQNDAGEVGSWLVDLDRFARAEVGALDLLLTAHAGWNAERTRGSSALEDWADAVITLTKDDSDDGNGERYIRAMGRDVEIEEDRLTFDPATRMLTVAGSGSRKASKAAARRNELVDQVVDIVTAGPGINTSEICRRLRTVGVGFQRGDVGRAARSALDAGTLRQEPGGRGAVNYFPIDLSRPIPTPPGGIPLTYPHPSFRGGVGQQVESPPTYPDAGTLPEPARSCGHPGDPAKKCGTCIAEKLASRPAVPVSGTTDCEYCGQPATDPDGFCDAGDDNHVKARRMLGRPRAGDAA